MPPLKEMLLLIGTGHTSIMARTIGPLFHIAGGMLLARNDRLQNFLCAPRKEVEVPLMI